MLPVVADDDEEHSSRQRAVGLEAFKHTPHEAITLAQPLQVVGKFPSIHVVASQVAHKSRRVAGRALEHVRSEGKVGA